MAKKKRKNTKRGHKRGNLQRRKLILSLNLISFAKLLNLLEVNLTFALYN